MGRRKGIRSRGQYKEPTNIRQYSSKTYSKSRFSMNSSTREFLPSYSAGSPTYNAPSAQGGVALGDGLAMIVKLSGLLLNVSNKIAINQALINVRSGLRAGQTVYVSVSYGMGTAKVISISPTPESVRSIGQANVIPGIAVHAPPIIISPPEPFPGPVAPPKTREDPRNSSEGSRRPARGNFDSHQSNNNNTGNGPTNPSSGPTSPSSGLGSIDGGLT